MFNDFITINGHHTFCKSKVEGVESGYKESNGHYNCFYVIISGNKIEVDRSPVPEEYLTKEVDKFSETTYTYVKDQDRTASIELYHRKWLKYCGVGEQEIIEKEKVMI